MSPNRDNVHREYDVFKDSLLRYLGYANEVGESFRFMVPVKVVWFSYFVSSGYVIADALDKGYKVWKKPFQREEKRLEKTAIATIDTLIWQGLASVVIPGFTINRICWATNKLMTRTALPQPVKKWSVVVVGIGSIPFIVKPIDRAVDLLMDSTLRKLYNHK
ncbi:mitochondrial fission process protein 1-like [Biomphalaria glabrata]|uniref:Mitochondrial fission process protein 1 n=1 Tax=Biomphalaria glabrata TaxID=6526 RepID=A0A9U8EJM3_BIOGL|nr:mitochondrial fission process protein 1-like [Biomphalaria glabrata]